MSNHIPYFLDYVWSYVEKGWRVLPVSGKIALTAHGLLDASIDPAVIKQWWGPNGRYKNSNIAIRTGSLSDLVVLDVDVQHNGLVSFAEMDLANLLPKTPMVRTGRGGMHFYFRHKEAKNSAGKIAEGIDIRGGRNGKDGYVVAPPSIHPDTGVAYEWEVLPSEVEVAELPEFLLEIIRKASEKKSLDFGPGKRNTSMVQLAGAMHRVGAGPIETRAALMAFGTQREGLEEAEVDHIIEQSLNWTAPLPPQTEIGQAELLKELYSDQLLYDRNREAWLIWGGHHWKPTKEPYRFVKDGARYRAQRVSMAMEKVTDEEEMKTLTAAAKWASGLESARAVAAVTTLLEKEMAKDYELDKDPYLLGVPNGVVNLITGELMTGSPDQYITRSTIVDYDPDALAIRWEQFVREIFRDRDGKERPDLVDYVQRAIGYAITGDVGKQCWFLCLGEGSNGKGTFLGTIKEILGTYAQKMSIKTITVRASRRGVDNDVADLNGPRFLLSSEAGSTVELDSERIKDLVGSDSVIRASRMYKEDIEFVMKGKMFMPNNHDPRTNDNTPGFWRRVRVLPFEQSFPVNDEIQKLIALEYPGILAWCVRGAVEYIQRGLPALDDPLCPEAVKYRTTQIQDNNDPLILWFRDTFVTKTDGKVRASQVYPSYISWCIANGIGERERVHRRRTAEYLNMKFGMKRDSEGYYYPGVGVKTGE